MNKAVLASLARSLQPVDLEALARIRGAMWTARGPLQFGPRPNQPDNCLCMDYFECYSRDDQERIIQLYVKDRRYSHAPMGPLVDPGYHGQLPATDWRSDPSVYLDAADMLESAGVHVVHFLRPDRGVDGLDWTVDELERELGSIFRSAHAQDTMQIVCLGWEPGPRYFYDNAWWVEMTTWMAQTFPRALRLIHMVSDADSPVGADDDTKGITNGDGWANLARNLHGFLAQYGGYVGGQSVSAFVPNFQAALEDLMHRFATGGPDGTWPTFSAWGDGKPIRVYAGEYAAFRDYWENAPERESVDIGNAALAIGAAGYFDGGSDGLD